MGIRNMYGVYNFETEELFPEYVETRATTDTGWLALFHKCYPNYAKGVGMYTVDQSLLSEGMVDILNSKGEVIVQFELVY